jgi:hypothetical protein
MTDKFFILLLVPVLTSLFGAQCAVRLFGKLSKSTGAIRTLALLLAIGFILALLRTSWLEELVKTIYVIAPSVPLPTDSNQVLDRSAGIVAALRIILIPLILGSLIFSALVAVVERATGKSMGRAHAALRPAVLAAFIVVSFGKAGEFAESLARSAVSTILGGS